MDGVKVFMDDIRITRSDEILHFTALEEFFKKCREHGLNLNLNKTSDASPVGIGITPDGSECLITFASRTSSGIKQKYSQIEKEALSIVWAVKKFYLYLKGKEGKDLQGREAQYTIEDGCITYGQRLCIRKKFQKNVLEELHAGLLGIVNMKAIARSFVYWKNIDKDIEEAEKNRANCARHKTNPTKAKVHYWEYPSMPWEHIHVDFAGPNFEQIFCMIIDTHSK
ncbi:uncharacterized protein K02A2.6 [Trichonephila inaurata madagascariensis]|uniref:RNA-directed DNA polymerase n=1 Tax=Trichonephila inaurata madagascariensis TaxID=2747483 RepID=A0A8X6YAJ0_9ARAC|nr:uncharacterized protein K02A2.6 [Trichonephila inaurata madagascariensis]